MTPGLLPMLGASPPLGRMFAAGRRRAGTRSPSLILSYGLWQQRFGGRADVVGQTLRLDATTYTIVGVMPAAFAFPDRDTRAWAAVPRAAGHDAGTEGFYDLDVPGDRPAAARRDRRTGRRRRHRARPRGRRHRGLVAMAVFGSNGPVEVTAMPLLEALTGDVKPAILILLAAVVLLLVTATANVASLQLARATARRRELAIRAALGAARGRLVRQTLVENLLLGLLGGVAGLALAARDASRAAGGPAGRLSARRRPRVRRPHPGVRGRRVDCRGPRLRPAAGAAHRARAISCRRWSRTRWRRSAAACARARARVRAVIMAGQVAIACVLLVGALLLVRSFVGMMTPTSATTR